MNIFETVKSSLDLKDTARHYEIEVNRAGFACCLFHNDRTPSMKLYKDNFYCFSCGKSGDVISLIAEKLSVSQYESAKILSNDFHLTQDEFAVYAKPQLKKTHSEWEMQTFKLLNNYFDYLKYFKEKYAPKPDEEPSPLYIESLHMMPQVEYYLDSLIYDPPEKRQKFIEEHNQQLDDIEVKLDEYKRKYRI